MDQNFRDRMPRVQQEVYTTGHAHSWVYNALPGPVTSLYSLLAAGSITGLAYFFGNMGGNNKGDQWMMIAIAAMTLIGIIAFLFSARKAKRAAKARETGLGSAIKNSTAGWDTADGDAQDIAKRDELRKKFQHGIDTFTQHEKSLYDMPWYIMVGEQSSGKSEAIRSSELRFPEGLHEKLQGVGGTQLMNWWFTDNAVILDTAGALLMDAEAAQRFGDFLTLLRDHRTDYPINGLILTLPVDKLLMDLPDKALEKARIIAEQLKVIQKALDVRFPMYVMVSKSDLLPGFKEFADAEGQGVFQADMLGWSNPAPLDEPFDAARIEEALDAISDRLRGRVLNLIADPTSGMNNRRTDEVDVIYSFPAMLRNLAPQLRCYLEVFFQTGTWASKPPFFRGIYFTSAIRKGNELDQALADALGTSVNMLPGGSIFTIEKSVFLRDLFLNKIFLEKGLVTRLKNVGALLRRRLITFFLITLGLMAVLLIFAFNVRAGIKNQLLEEQTAWVTANQSWDNGVMLPLVARMSNNQGPPSWTWVGNTREGKDPTRFELMKRLVAKTAEPLRMSWVFSPLPEWRAFERRRHQAALTVFEAGVVKPVLDAARERILWDTANSAALTPETQGNLAKAYEQLIQLEAWVADGGRSASGKLSPPDLAGWKSFYEVVLTYVLGQRGYQGVNAENLAEQTFAIYAPAAKLGQRGWLAETTVPGTPSLVAAAKMLFGQAAAAAEMSDQQRSESRQRKTALLQQFTEAENRLLSWAREPGAHYRTDVEKGGMAVMEAAAEEYNKLTVAETGKVPTSLTPDDIKRLASLTVEVNEVAELPDLKPSLANARRLAGKTSVTQDDKGDNQWIAALKRLDHYQKNFASVSTEDIQLSTESILGSLANRVKVAADEAAKLAQPAIAAKTRSDPAQPADVETEVAAYLSQFRGSGLVSRVFSDYQATLNQTLNVLLKFPLTADGGSYESLARFNTDCEVLTKIEKDAADLSSVAPTGSNVPERKELEALFGRLQSVFRIKKTLQGAGVPGAGGGLKIEFGAVQPPVKNEIVTPGQTTTSGFLSKKTTTTPPTVKIEMDGVTHIAILVAGIAKIDQAPSGVAPPPADWDGFSAVEVRVSTVTPAAPTEKVDTYKSGPGWELLRESASGRAFSVGGAKTSFRVVAYPPLPSPWPRRSDFGLR